MMRKMPIGRRCRRRAAGHRLTIRGFVAGWVTISGVVVLNMKSSTTLWKKYGRNEGMARDSLCIGETRWYGYLKLPQIDKNLKKKGVTQWN